VILTHFPVSFFAVSFGFMVLHLITWAKCYEWAAYVSLLAGMGSMWPTTLSGWFVWKDRYKGARGKVFLNKIKIAYGMIAISTGLVIWRTVFPHWLHTYWLGLYFICVGLLLLGAMAEGFFGGRLNHR